MADGPYETGSKTADCTSQIFEVFREITPRHARCRGTERIRWRHERFATGIRFPRGKAVLGLTHWVCRWIHFIGRRCVVYWKYCLDTLLGRAGKEYRINIMESKPNFFALWWLRVLSDPSYEYSTKKTLQLSLNTSEIKCSLVCSARLITPKD
jgi:hypothetical protein